MGKVIKISEELVDKMRNEIDLETRTQVMLCTNTDDVIDKYKAESIKMDDSHYLPCICSHNRRRSTIDGNGNVTVTCYKCKYTMKFSLEGGWSDSKVRKIWNNEMRRIENG